MIQNGNEPAAKTWSPIGAWEGGLARWLLGKLRGSRRPAPRLVILERIALAPRQSLVLVEAEGRRFLVATSPEGTPAFHALDTLAPQPDASEFSASAQTKGRNGLRPAKRSGVDRDSRVSC
jgi:flagellar biogenesis protein FliO